MEYLEERIFTFIWLLMETLNNQFLWEEKASTQDIYLNLFQ